nr:MAG TPA: hypothetical protein [Caudoviricetes sp.]
MISECQSITWISLILTPSSNKYVAKEDLSV